SFRYSPFLAMLPSFYCFFPNESSSLSVSSFPYTTLFRSRPTAVSTGEPPPAGHHRALCAQSQSHSTWRWPRTLCHVVCPTTHRVDRKRTRLNSSHVSTSYAVFCLKK